MQIGIDSFAAAISDPATGLTLSPVERMHHLLEEIELADKVGLDVFGIGERHCAEFLDSTPVVILSAAATRTENIRLTSAVTVPLRGGCAFSHGRYPDAGRHGRSLGAAWNRRAGTGDASSRHFGWRQVGDRKPV
jgi:hypothetical protein